MIIFRYIRLAYEAAGISNEKEQPRYVQKPKDAADPAEPSFTQYTPIIGVIFP